MSIALVDVPEHVRALVRSATADAMSVVADWFEDQGDLARAERIRSGGDDALLEFARLASLDRTCMVYFNSERAFETCTVELELLRDREPLRDFTGRVVKWQASRTRVRAKVSGVFAGGFPRPDCPEEAAFLARGIFVSCIVTNISTSFDLRRGASLEIEGIVRVHELVGTG